mmetsp:Transcript_6117/g.16622  ORF Transcript_6117/g.16622 Transcript_6117/m.16622 type:complete len:307 (-) Transcript_6117:355-1275(-)
MLLQRAGARSSRPASGIKLAVLVSAEQHDDLLEAQGLRSSKRRGVGARRGGPGQQRLARPEVAAVCGRLERGLAVAILRAGVRAVAEQQLAQLHMASPRSCGECGVARTAELSLDPPQHPRLRVVLLTCGAGGRRLCIVPRPQRGDHRDKVLAFTVVMAKVLKRGRLVIGEVHVALQKSVEIDIEGTRNLGLFWLLIRIGFLYHLLLLLQQALRLSKLFGTHVLGVVEHRVTPAPFDDALEDAPLEAHCHGAGRVRKGHCVQVRAGVQQGLGYAGVPGLCGDHQRRDPGRIARGQVSSGTHQRLHN